MTLKSMSHRNDPETSELAVIQLSKHDTAKLKDALLILLDEQPRTADELTSVYAHQAELRVWPLLVDQHNVKRRLSELHAKHHVVRESGDRRPSRMGRPATVWELAIPLWEARLLVGAS